MLLQEHDFVHLLVYTFLVIGVISVESMSLTRLWQEYIFIFNAISCRKWVCHLREKKTTTNLPRSGTNISDDRSLKLVRTLLNYRVLGTSTAGVFSFKLSFSLWTYITRMNVMLDFILYGTSRSARSASKAKKFKMKNSYSQWETDTQTWDLKSDALPTKLTGLRRTLYHLNDLYKYMCFLYPCI